MCPSWPTTLAEETESCWLADAGDGVIPTHTSMGKQSINARETTSNLHSTFYLVGNYFWTGLSAPGLRCKENSYPDQNKYMGSLNREPLDCSPQCCGCAVNECLAFTGHWHIFSQHYHPNHHTDSHTNAHASSEQPSLPPFTGKVTHAEEDNGRAGGRAQALLC